MRLLYPTEEIERVVIVNVAGRFSGPQVRPYDVRDHLEEIEIPASAFDERPQWGLKSQPYAQFGKRPHRRLSAHAAHRDVFQNELVQP